MSAEAMPPARRRPIPGMTPAPSVPPPPQPASFESDPARSHGASSPAGETPAPGARPRRRTQASAGLVPPASGAARDAGPTVESEVRERRPAADYAATRLVNFRIPVDLHDRYRRLVREAELEHPRLRHPSLTELVIALLEEGPGTPDEVADLIRRKRVGEHAAEVPQ